MAGPFPLATLSFTITPAGISAPSFADILSSLQASYQGIYGLDVYLDPDSQDGQWISIIAAAINDVNQQAIALYNSFSPLGAVGTGLSNLVKINGLQREVPSNSACPVTVVGQPGTQIVNGIVGDNQNLGTQWALPPLVLVPPSGQVVVTATCTVAGAFPAAPNTLTTIITPTAGWQTVTNGATAATTGNPVESDGALRQRQSVSTSLPALTPLGAIFANIANVPGVSRLFVYENDTAAPDVNGIPSHSISAVVQGGTVAAITSAIAAKKNPGTGTFGTTSAVVVDPAGVPNTVNYFVLANTRIFVSVSIKALQGFVASTSLLIQQALAFYVSTLPIGGKVMYFKLGAPVNLEGLAAQTATGLIQSQLEALASTFEVTALTVGLAPAPGGTADIAIAFNNAANLAINDVAVTVS